MAGSRRTATRVTPGAICLSSSSHFPPMLIFERHEPGGVAARPRQAVDEAGADWIDDIKHDRHGAGRLQQRPHGALPMARMTSGASATNSAAYLRMASALPAPQRISIRRLRPSVQPNCCSPCRNAARRACIPDRPRRRHEHADAPHPLGLLRARRERPCRRAATSVMNWRRLTSSMAQDPSERVEAVVAASVASGAAASVALAAACGNPHLTHSITSSARASSVGGTSRPSALAVFRLMISSTLVDCWTGRSAGFSPLRMRPE